MTNEEKQFEKQYNYFESKREKYGFQTIWCVYEIRALSLKSPFQAKYMIDGVNSIQLNLPNRKLTGLELWRYADMIYDTINGGDHKFIEAFEQKGDTIEVHFGS